jgi:Arc/MetJ family transcription regulator
MRTNVVINDALMSEAIKYSVNITTKKAVIELALQEYVNNRKRKNLQDLRGKITFCADYDYKAMRS